MKFLDESGLSYFWSKLKAMFAGKADSLSNGVAIRSAGILYGEVDNTSTNTVFTATISGITTYYDGLTVMLKNGVVTSASGFTLNINGLGAKPSYSNMATGNPVTPTAPTRETTIFNINYTMLFVYSTDIVDGGGWICYRGYDANTNTIGYQVRTNSYSLPMDSITYRYRLLFTSANGQKWIPSNNSTSTNATAKRDVVQAKIDPFGSIVYYGTTASVAAGSRPSATALWQQYTATLGYSFNRSGAALTLTSWKPVYIKCAPQTDGSAIIDATTPYVQDLPSTEDGKIYIFLGVAYSATAVEITINHPVYWYKNGYVRLWTNAVSGGAVDSVNGQTGVVVLDADDIGAVDKNHYKIAVNSNLYPITNWSRETVNGISGVLLYYDDVTQLGGEVFLPDGEGFNTGSQAIISQIPTKTSDLTNDSGFVTSSGVTGVVINTTAEPYDLPITNGNAKLDIGDGLSVSDSSGVELKHATGAGWKHIPSGGASGQFLGYSSSGTASWQTPPTPTVPTKTSDLTNDSGFVTSAAVPSAATANPLMDGTAAVGSSSKYAKEDHVHPTDTSRQAVLVSGQNLKTVNNESLLGSGNIDIQGGGGTALTDQEVEDAVNAAFRYVSIYLTNPVNPSDFSSFKVYVVAEQYDTYWEADTNKGAEIASIDSPTGSVQFAWDTSNYGIVTKATGSYVASGSYSITGDATRVDSDYEGGEFFAITGECKIILDGIDYDD